MRQATPVWTIKGSGMLSSNERAIMIRCCHAHAVAFCHVCDQSYRIQRLGADWFRGKTELCPRCRADLSDSIREHLRSCALVVTLRSELLVAESKALCEESVARRKDARQAADETATHVAEAEVQQQRPRARPAP